MKKETMETTTRNKKLKNRNGNKRTKEQELRTKETKEPMKLEGTRNKNRNGTWWNQWNQWNLGTRNQSTNGMMNRNLGNQGDKPTGTEWEVTPDGRPHGHGMTSATR